jgi:hypothetical protein
MQDMPVKPETQEVALTYGRVSTIWWAWTWRTTLALFALYFVVGNKRVIFMVATHAATPRTMAPDGLLSLRRFVMLPLFIINALVGIWMLRKVFNKHFNGFRIALIKQQEYYTDPF